MKKRILLLAFIPFFGCAEMQQVIEQLPQTQGTLGQMGIGQAEISSGLKEALNKGIEKQVVKLTAADGFYKNEMVKILLPEELKKVDKTLRDIGMSKLADEGLKVMNRAAEDAVKQATPIFVDAVKGMSFTDAKNILLGNERSATTYLESSTSTALYSKFNPVIKQSFSKVGADKVWSTIITKYNSVPLVKKVNPDLTDYTTNKAMEGVFKMIAVEEKDIRTNLSSRSTDLLKKVFALQDKKQI
ncbi:MAG TPA: DUF4197 domain-containing protein [Flavobacterium sp.]|uniref:DUF4197 domain-containing protein n=1 Tax=Flavobacterium sp. TaxID=239 RepID=UPI002C117595|nr:DUF4197 domain-containing protein [Flavobacterium sp.]HSD14615.1 DUF4197 domain-containing protein [Flavobacterium sp.]